MGLLFALYLGRSWVLSQVAYFLDVSTPPQPCDYVLVLGGGANSRPFVAAALVRSGLAKGVLIPTVKRSAENLEGTVPTEQELIRQVLLARGVPAEVLITLPGECSSTQEEARVLKQFLQQHPEARVAIVTHQFHTRRARLQFRRELGERMNQVSLIGVPSDTFDAENWWQREEGVVTYLNEYLKWAFYSAK